MSSATLATAAAGITERIRTLAARPEALTLRELIDRRMAIYAGRDKALGYRLEVWRTLLGDFTLERIDADVIHAARAELQALPALAFKGRDHEGRHIFKPKAAERAKCPGTINRYMGALSAVLTWAIEQRIAPRTWHANPCRGIKRLPGEVERVRFLEPAELDRLLKACKTREKRRGARYPRLHALVLMALLTGARRGELMGLKWGDVDLAAGIARLGRTKNGDRRTLVLLPQVVQALQPFASPDAGRYVFGSPSTQYRGPASLDTAWRKALARAQIEDFRFHDLRHCCASYMVQAGIDLAVVADILGHRKLDMTKRYAHLKIETKARAMREALGSIGLAA